MHESLVGQYEYTTEPKWCHVFDTKGEILLVILLNEFVLVLLILILVYGRVKAVAESQEWSSLGFGNFMWVIS